MNKDKTVAFLDLLAFSNYVRKNTLDALKLFENYNNVITTKITDEKIKPSSDYSDSSLRKLAEKTSINSFEYFIPFSDSVFISFENPNKFIKQVSSFVIGCFKLTSNEYMNPVDNSRPDKVKTKSPKINNNGEVEMEDKFEIWYPTLFRGGISFGEAYPIKLVSIFDYKPTTVQNLAGKSVVNAVKLEEQVKGPLIICDESVYNVLDANIKFFLKKIDDKKIYKILWPAFYYIENNGKSEISKFDDFFKPAVKFWKANNHKPYSIHYFNFLKFLILIPTYLLLLI